MFKRNKKSKKRKEDRPLTTYDKFNLPLRAGSTLHQGSREVRSWIKLARDSGLL